VHRYPRRSAALRVGFGLAAGSTVDNLALIPGTKSLWGAGELAAAPGSDAAIWGHGPAT